MKKPFSENLHKDSPEKVFLYPCLPVPDQATELRYGGGIPTVCTDPLGDKGP